MIESIDAQYVSNTIPDTFPNFHSKGNFSLYKLTLSFNLHAKQTLDVGKKVFLFSNLTTRKRIESLFLSVYLHNTKQVDMSGSLNT